MLSANMEYGKTACAPTKLEMSVDLGRKMINCVIHETLFK